MINSIKKFTLIAFIALFSLHSKSQQLTAVKFERNLNWNQILAKAKSEHKYIFVSCIAASNARSMAMDNVVFSKKEVGDAMNEKFICIEAQMEPAESDDPFTKSWYAETRKIKEQYQVSNYPTFLFFDSAGKIVHRGFGLCYPATFLSIINDAVDPEKQYYPNLDKFNHGNLQYQAMPALALNAKAIQDSSTMKKVTLFYETHYLFKQKNSMILTSEHLKFIKATMTGTTNEDFRFFAKHTVAVDSILGKNEAEQKMLSIIFEQDIKPLTSSLTNDNAFDELETSLTNKYGRLGMLAVRLNRIYYYDMTARGEDWPAFVKAFKLYYSEVGELNILDVNNMAFDVFQHSNDSSALNLAIKLVNPLKESDINSMDTYANLLYKTGQKDEAIIWEQKAVDKIPANPDPTYQQTLEKMKKGLPTW